MSHKKGDKVSYHRIDSNCYGHNLLFGRNPSTVISGKLSCGCHRRRDYQHFFLLRSNLSGYRALWKILPEISTITLLKNRVFFILPTSVQNALINDIKLLDNRLRDYGYGVLWQKSWPVVKHRKSS